MGTFRISQFSLSHDCLYFPSKVEILVELVHFEENFDFHSRHEGKRLLEQENIIYRVEN